MLMEEHPVNVFLDLLTVIKKKTVRSSGMKQNDEDEDISYCPKR